MPDAELFKLADSGQLLKPTELERQVNVLTRINLEKSSALESAKRHAILLQNGEPGTSSMLPENQMQMLTRGPCKRCKKSTPGDP